MLAKKTGDAVKTGDVIATLHTNKTGITEKAAAEFFNAIEVSEEKPPTMPLVYDVVV